MLNQNTEGHPPNEINTNCIEHLFIHRTIDKVLKLNETVIKEIFADASFLTSTNWTQPYPMQQSEIKVAI